MKVVDGTGDPLLAVGDGWEIEVAQPGCGGVVGVALLGSGCWLVGAAPVVVGCDDPHPTTTMHPHFDHGSYVQKIFDDRL